MVKLELRRTKLAFVGAGWIGRNRMEAAFRSGRTEVASVVDLDLETAGAAAESVGCGEVTDALDAALDARPDGVVIATPNAVHAEQALAALEAGIPVFCQKPLARSGVEARRLVDAARRSDVSLGVDMSYRHVAAFVRAREALREAPEHVFAADLTFHNAYGPDKPWFTDPSLSGGGCALDLATHLIDLVWWFLDPKDRPEVVADLYRRGEPLIDPNDEAEDYASILLRFEDAVVRLSCSWFLSAGEDAALECSFYTPASGIHVENVNGSYYDFRSERRRGTQREALVEPPDDWAGRALIAWSDRIARDPSFDTAIHDAVRVADVIDRIYGRTA